MRDPYRAIEAARRRHGVDPHLAMAPLGARVKGYRISGGAIVTVMRPDGRSRRYRVRNSRFRALQVRFNALNWGGAYLYSSLDVQCRVGVQRIGGRR